MIETDVTSPGEEHITVGLLKSLMPTLLGLVSKFPTKEELVASVSQVYLRAIQSGHQHILALLVPLINDILSTFRGLISPFLHFQLIVIAVFSQQATIPSV